MNAISDNWIKVTVYLQKYSLSNSEKKEKFNSINDNKFSTFRICLGFNLNCSSVLCLQPFFYTL